MVEWKKGITPVVAIVLLLMVTIGAVSMAFVWFKQFQQSVQGGVEESQKEMSYTIGTQVEIISVYEDSSTNPPGTMIVLKNVGETTIFNNELNSATVLIDGRIVSCSRQGSGNLAPQGTVEYQCASYSFSSNLADGESHIIKIKIGKLTVPVACGPLNSDDTSCNI